MKEKLISNFKLEHSILKHLKTKGIDRNMVEVLPELFDREPEKGETYYYYNGPLDEKTRDFCKHVLKIDKVISLAEIEALSGALGYDVLKYKGSYNCRHQWVKFRGKIISTPKITINQIRQLIKKGIKG